MGQTIINPDSVPSSDIQGSLTGLVTPGSGGVLLSMSLEAKMQLNLITDTGFQRLMSARGKKLVGFDSYPFFYAMT